MMPPKVCYTKKQDISVFRNIEPRARTKLVYSVEIISELLGKKAHATEVQFNTQFS